MPTHFQGRKDTVRALSAFINLVRASDSVVSRLSAQIEQSGLTMGQFGVMEALHHLGPMCQRTLGEKLLRSGGNVTLVIDNLEKHGWVRRERQKDDRRLVKIYLTPKGERLIARIFPGHAEAVAQEFSRLSAEEQETLRRICRKLGQSGEKVAGNERCKKENQHDSDSTQ
ncbi:MAG: MarR family winged helix-turn-helix transcriptional regulator [Candidatus Acidiferrales bacterium]